MPLRQLEHQLQALREAFIAMLPYVLFHVGVLLISQFAQLQPWFDLQGLANISAYLATQLLHCFPLVLSLSISLHSANMFGVSRSLTMLASLLVLISYISLDNQIHGDLFDLGNIPPFGALVSALLTVHWLKLFFIRNKLDSRYMLVSGEALRIFRYLVPTILATIASLISLLLLASLSETLGSWLNWHMLSLSGEVNLLVKTIISHLFWFIGIHGDHVYRMLFSIEPLLTPWQQGLTYQNIFDLFMVFGGSGACLSLIIGLLIQGHHNGLKRLAMLGLPFSIFNISEIIVFGLPIVFNRTLLMPFVLVPCVNLALALLLIPLLDIHFYHPDIPWITPIFINAYMATDGNSNAMLLQLFMLLVGTAIYWPFIQNFSQQSHVPTEITHFYRKLNMLNHLSNHERLQFWRNRNTLEQQRQDALQAFELIQNNHLDLYFQPIVDPQTLKSKKLECLIRLKTPTGYVPTSQLLGALEATNLASTVDFWVIQQIGWRLSKGKLPNGLAVTINVHPHTLMIDFAVDHIINHLQGLPIELEVLERGQADRTAIALNLHRLKAAGFAIGMDDFGTGYSNLANLNNMSPDFVKVDRSLLANTENDPKQTQLFTHVCQMLSNLGYDIIVEGVENLQQHALARSLGAYAAQGWFYSQALPWDEAMEFIAKENILNHS